MVHVASANPDEVMLKLLIENYGANIDIEDENGHTPIFSAVAADR